MTTPELSRKVRQLDGDVNEIYGMLADISSTQAKHGVRLDDLGQKLNGVDGTLRRHSNRLDDLAARLDAHDRRFDAVDARLDEILSLLRTTDE